MATKIVTKNSSTASAVPTASDLVQGELAVNVADKKLFTEDNSGAIIELADGVKLAGIEASADVTDTANVTAAGALMDSELTSEASVKALNQGVATTDSPAFAGLTVDTTTLAVDSTNNRVGIGTASPSETLHMFKATYPIFKIESTSYNGTLGIDTGNGNLVLNNVSNAGLLFNTNNTERMRIDSSGNVGIGTTTVGQFESIAVGLTVDSGNVYSGIAMTDGATTSTLAQGYSTTYLYNQANGGILFGTNNTERMRIDSSGQVGIGTSSPTYALSVKALGSSTVPASFESSGSSSWLMLKDSGTTLGNVRVGSSAGALVQYAGGAEALRIDSSGRLLVGQTSVSSGGAEAGNAIMYVDGGFVRGQASFSNFNEAWASGQGTIFEARSGFSPSNKPNSEGWFHVKTITTQTSGSNFYLTQTCTTLVGRIYTRYNSSSGSSSAWSSWVEK
jgi:hypothetical protein